MTWHSTRNLPANWGQIRAAVLERDLHRCQWIIDGHLCGAEASECDHIIRGKGDQPSNLRALCSYHHRRKSSAEGNAARSRVRAARPEAKHPGLT